MAKKNDAAIAQITELAERMAGKMGYELVEAAFEKENTGVYLMNILTQKVLQIGCMDTQ